MAKMMSASTSIAQPRPSSVRTIPGGYGWPVVGPISDRLDYFWFQGPETFFKKRIEKNKSTVFRTNVPPTFPLFTRVNPNVIAVLDIKSFSHLFDMDVVEKADTLVGDFMPSVSYTGGMRVCAYLDTSEPKHSKIKGFVMDILRRSSATWVPTVLSKLDSMWSTIDTEFSSSSSSSSANYLVPLQQCIFSFLSQCLLGADPAASPNIANRGYVMLDLWLGLMLLPTIKIGYLQPLEEIFLHSFAYPSFLVSGGYNKLAKFVEEEGREVVERGVREFGLTRDEAVHNALFTLGFNAYGGFSIFFPSLLGMLGSDVTVQEKLREEARAKGGSTLSFNSVKDMELVQSFVYETLRLNPPVPTQYGRARKDFSLSSHESVFEIKKGELLCGYQPLVMKDPTVFDEPEKFVFDRFTKEKGSELLRYLYWSNGPQTGSPSESNKQCPAKDYVTVTASLFVAHLLRRYDSIACNSSGSITALVKAK